jgi:hypothetical protein
VATAERGDAGVPGRCVELVERLVLGELPGERVLATARTDDQYLHEPESKTGGGWFEGALKGRMQPV